MATTAFDCGYEADYVAGNWVFNSAFVDSFGDQLCWEIGINLDGTFAAKNDDSRLNE